MWNSQHNGIMLLVGADSVLYTRLIYLIFILEFLVSFLDFKIIGLFWRPLPRDIASKTNFVGENQCNRMFTLIHLFCSGLMYWQSRSFSVFVSCVTHGLGKLTVDINNQKDKILIYCCIPIKFFFIFTICISLYLWYLRQCKNIMDQKYFELII